MPRKAFRRGICSHVIGPGKPMSELKDPAHKIGLGWLRKKGWAAIQAGEIKPMGSAPEGKDEEILETLLAGPKSSADLDKKGLADLKSRGLVAFSKSKDWRYEITDAGEKCAVFMESGYLQRFRRCRTPISHPI